MSLAYSGTRSLIAVRKSICIWHRRWAWHRSAHGQRRCLKRENAKDVLAQTHNVRTRKVDMMLRPIQVDDRLFQYLHGNVLREHPACRALREATSAHPHAGMQVLPPRSRSWRCWSGCQAPGT